MRNSEMSIGEVIKNKRIALNMKQEDVAEQMKVTVQTISKWERDASEPKATFVPQLSKVLKVSEKELCRGAINQNDIEIIEFISGVERAMRNLPTTQFLVELYDHLEDRVSFVKDIREAAGEPTLKEEYVAQSKHWLEMAENGNITFQNDEEKQKFFEMHRKITGQ